MKQRDIEKIVIAAVLVLLGVLASVFPVRMGFFAVAIGMLGILYAVILWTLYRTSFRTRQTLMLAFAAIVSGIAGILLLLDHLFYFMDMRYLLLAELLSIGMVTVGFGLQLKDRRMPVWLYVVIAGCGAAVAGGLALLRVGLAVTVACGTAAVILLLPLVRRAVSDKKNGETHGKKSKIVTVKEKDIEIIEDDCHEEK